MNIKQLAILLIRISGVEYLFNTASMLTSLPSYVARANLSVTERLPTTSLISLKWFITGFFLHLSWALGLLVYARTIAEFLTQDLGEKTGDLDRSAIT
jgi:hypothetical protein